MNQTEATALLKGEFGKVLLKNMINYVTSVAWGEFSGGDFKIDNSGTAFFLNLGEGTFIVTAAHVYEGYLDAKSKNTNLRCVLGSLEIDLEARCKGYIGSKKLDVATFHIEPNELERTNKHICYGASKRVTEGSGVLIGGFPGLEREKVDAQEYSFGLYAALTPVNSSSDRHFGCVLDRAGWIDTFGQGLPEIGYDMGGMSGGPAFLFQESEGAIITWDLAGVIYSSSTELGEVVFCHHAQFIAPDGSLIEA
jgi:hypothetical protein